MNEVVAVLPVDPYVEVPFFKAVQKLESVIRDSGASIALMGVKPTEPSEKYGYIVPDTAEQPISDGDYFRVSHFTEKPNEEKALELMSRNALWNCGVFAFKLDHLINLLIAMELPIQYDEMLKQYHQLPKISFDYEVVEKAEHIAVLPFDGCWKDLGTWNTLTEEMEQPVIGNGTVSEDSHNVHLINELDIPVAVLGLSDIIVSTSPDGILVAHKDASPRVKDAIKGLEQRPMYEERRWGCYRVLDYITLADGSEVLTKRIVIQAGKNLSYQQHFKRSEVWTVIAGHGEAVLNGDYSTIQAGDVLRVPIGTLHSIRASTDLEIIEVQTGTELVEDDIIRLCLSWDEILEFCR